MGREQAAGAPQRYVGLTLTSQGYSHRYSQRCPYYCRPASILALLVFLLVLVLDVIAALALVLPAVGEARVAEAGADGQHAPALDILHERHFAQALRHAVIVHKHRGVGIADLRNRFDQARGQIELAALPVARQVLRALLDRAVLVDHARTGDPDERREL